MVTGWKGSASCLLVGVGPLDLLLLLLLGTGVVILSKVLLSVAGIMVSGVTARVPPRLPLEATVEVALSSLVVVRGVILGDTSPVGLVVRTAEGSGGLDIT